MNDRLTELLSERDAAIAEVGEAEPELLGRIGWLLGWLELHPFHHASYESLLPLRLQPESVQAYYRGYEAEAIRSRKSKETT